MNQVRNSFSVREIAVRNGISHMTVYKEINTGRLRSYKLGKCRRITLSAESDWIHAREAETSVA